MGQVIENKHTHRAGNLGSCALKIVHPLYRGASSILEDHEEKKNQVAFALL